MEALSGGRHYLSFLGFVLDEASLCFRLFFDLGFSLGFKDLVLGYMLGWGAVWAAPPENG
jgi:hypothetical protein